MTKSQQDMMPKNVYAVVLAGGSGTRFWPKSRQKTPKQLCTLGGSDQTMLEVTLSRLDGFIPPERRLIVTHVDQADATRKIVGVQCPLIIAEPEARNTANALAAAALEIERLHGSDDAIMISLHADHVVTKVDAMLQSFRTAVEVAKGGDLTLIGIVPQYPETGYGYIERGSSLQWRGAYSVASFREKPEFKVAKEFVDSGRFYWNAGLFVFPVRTFLAELQERLPQSIQGLRNLMTSAKGSGLAKIDAKAFADVYQTLPKISVDHAVLEVSKRVSVVEADMGWQDVGSWDALGQCFSVDKDGNFVQGDALLIETTNSTIDSDGPLIAALGVKDLVIVHARNAILVCPKSRAQDVKFIVEQLKAKGRSDLT